MVPTEGELTLITGPDQRQLRWRNVVCWALPFALVSFLVAGLFADDAWLPLFPREPGRRLTDLFLRSLLVAYLTVVVLVPLVLAVSVWLVIRARRRGDLAQIYRDVAARHNTILVDGPEILRAKSRHGILDDELFHDAHHPTLASHLNLAQAVLDQLHKRRALGLGGDGAPAPSLDPAECASHFQIDFRV
jgi:hypothetical protein